MHRPFAAFATVAWLLLTAIGCTQPGAEQGAASHENAQQWTFLGIPEDAVQKVDDRESALFGITTITKVQAVDYGAYQRMKADEELKAEELHDGHIDFAVESGRDVRFNSASAWVTVTERYKAPLPSNE